MTANDDVSSILYPMEYAYSAGELRGDAGDGLDGVPGRQAAGGQGHDARRRVLRRGRSSRRSAPRRRTSSTPTSSTTSASTAPPTPFSPDCTQAADPAGDAPLWTSRWEEDRPPLDDRARPSSSGTAAWTAREAGLGRVREREFTICRRGARPTTQSSICFDDRRPAPRHHPRRAGRLREPVDRGARRRRHASPPELPPTTDTMDERKRHDRPRLRGRRRTIGSSPPPLAAAAADRRKSTAPSSSRCASSGPWNCTPTRWRAALNQTTSPSTANGSSGAAAPVAGAADRRGAAPVRLMPPTASESDCSSTGARPADELHPQLDVGARIARCSPLPE